MVLDQNLGARELLAIAMVVVRRALSENKPDPAACDGHDRRG